MDPSSQEGLGSASPSQPSLTSTQKSVVEEMYSALRRRLVVLEKLELENGPRGTIENFQETLEMLEAGEQEVRFERELYTQFLRSGRVSKETVRGLVEGMTALGESARNLSRNLETFTSSPPPRNGTPWTGKGNAPRSDFPKRGGRQSVKYRLR